MMSNVIPFAYKDKTVTFNFDAWINATEIAKQFGREPIGWLRLEETENYICSVSHYLGLQSEYSNPVPATGLAKYKGLVIVKRGSPAKGGGTWLHPKLGIAFARWLNSDFAAWCDCTIESLLRGDLQIKTNYSNAKQNLLIAKEKASQGGKQLANWRWNKGTLQQQVEYWGEQLNLVFDDRKALVASEH